METEATEADHIGSKFKSSFGIKQEEIHDFGRYMYANHRGLKNIIIARKLCAARGFRYAEGHEHTYGNGAGRRLRELVYQANLAGYFICATTRGYFVPTTQAEAELGMLKLRLHRRHLDLRLQALGCCTLPGAGA